MLAGLRYISIGHNDVHGRKCSPSLSAQVHYATYAAAAYEPNLAFIVLAQTEAAASRLSGAMQGYVAGHAVVRLAQLRPQREPSTHADAAGRDPTAHG